MIDVTFQFPERKDAYNFRYEAQKLFADESVATISSISRKEANSEGRPFWFFVISFNDGDEHLKRHINLAGGTLDIEVLGRSVWAFNSKDGVVIHD